MTLVLHSSSLGSADACVLGPSSRTAFGRLCSTQTPRKESYIYTLRVMLHIVYACGPVSNDQDFFRRTPLEKRDVFMRRLVML